MRQKKSNNESLKNDQSSTAAGNASVRAVLQKTAEFAPLPKVSSFATKRERLHYVADMIEQAALAKEGIGFNMTTWRHDPETSASAYLDQTGHACKTVGCIAGWTMFLENGCSYGVGELGNSFDGPAANILGLTSAEQAMLFLGLGHNLITTASGPLHSVTDKRAVAVIRDLADNGEVRWHRFDSEGKEKSRAKGS